MRRSLNVKAFTLLESLLTLFVACFLALTFSASVGQIFQDVEEKIFFLSFEHLYRDSQKLSAAQKSSIELSITSEAITNGVTSLSIPKSVSLLEEKNITFDAKGGNSSLSKIRFATDEQTITYQLYLGSGNYQKTTT